MSVERDIWSDWLLRRRSGGDSKLHERQMGHLHGVRDRVLKNAAIKPGNTVLDLGCGDGLIALGAIDLVGGEGRVIFSDISEPLLEHCRGLVEERGDVARCEFLRASADDLSALPDSSVDVVTTRSVLIYLRDKAKAIREAYRVLRPGGRLSIFEPINKHFSIGPTDKFWGLDVSPVRELAERVRPAYEEARRAFATAEDFDEHDLFRWVQDAGFMTVVMNCQMTAIDGRAVASWPRDWDTFANASPNPYSPSPYDAIKATLGDSDDARRLVAHLRAEFDRAEPRPMQNADAYLFAVKGGVDA